MTDNKAQPKTFSKVPYYKEIITIFYLLVSILDYKDSIFNSFY